MIISSWSSETPAACGNGVTPTIDLACVRSVLNVFFWRGGKADCETIFGTGGLLAILCALQASPWDNFASVLFCLRISVSRLYCKRPAEQRLHWERKEKRIPGQSITSPIVKSLSEASFGLMVKAKWNKSISGRFYQSRSDRLHSLNILEQQRCTGYTYVRRLKLSSAVHLGNDQRHAHNGYT